MLKGDFPLEMTLRKKSFGKCDFMPSFIEMNRASPTCKHNFISLLQAAIRDTLVLPNSESVGIRWMLAEKDDWVPRNVAPFIWINQESGNEISNPIDTNNQTSGGVKASAKTSGDSPEPKLQKLFSSEPRQDPARKSDSQAFPSSFSFSAAIRNSKSFDELSKPLLESGQQQETTDLKDLSMPSLESDHEASEEKTDDVSVSSSPSNSAVMDRSISSAQQDDDSMPKKIGRRERFLDFRKKMSEKVGGQKKLEEVKGFLLRR